MRFPPPANAPQNHRKYAMPAKIYPLAKTFHHFIVATIHVKDLIYMKYAIIYWV